jgi:hypothetical protein
MKLEHAILTTLYFASVENTTVGASGKGICSVVSSRHYNGSFYLNPSSPPMATTYSASSAPKVRPSASKIWSSSSTTLTTDRPRGTTHVLYSWVWLTAGHHHCMPSLRSQPPRTTRPRVMGKALAFLSLGIATWLPRPSPSQL